MNPKNKLPQKLERMQNYSLYVFVPAASIAIFSDNLLFEIICFIAGITFAVSSYLYHQL